MAEHKQIQQGDLEFKGFIEQTRKIGGRIVKEEVHAENFDDDAVAALLAGVTPEAIEEGREKLATEHPELLSAGVHEMLDSVAADFDRGEELSTPKHVASNKRLGKIMDDNGETMNFRRIAGGTKVEIYDDNSLVLSTLGNQEFDNLLDSGEFTVL